MLAIKTRRGISGEQIESIWPLLTVWPRIYHRSRARRRASCAYCVPWELGLAPTTSPSNLGRTGKHAYHHAPALSGIDTACRHRESRAHGSGAD